MFLASCNCVREKNLRRQTSFWIVGNDYARNANFSGRMDTNPIMDRSFIHFSAVSLVALEALRYKKTGNLSHALSNQV